MKFLIVLCAVVAVSMAMPGYLAGGPAGYAAAGYAAPGILGYSGVLGGGYIGAPGVIAAPAVVPAADAVPAGLALTPAGVPVDTPAVQAARASNAVAHINARGVAGVVGAGFVGGYGVVAAPAADVVPAGLALTPAGVPVDTPAVQAARASNAVAHINARGVAGVVGAGFVGGYGVVAAPAVVPAADVVPAGLALTPAGVPVDTPAVQAARAADTVAHLNAKAIHLG